MFKRSKFKRMMAVLLTLCIMASMAVVGSIQASAVISEDGLWAYTFSSSVEAGETIEYITIANYLGTEETVTLPEEIDGYVPNDVALSVTTHETLKNVHVPKNYVYISFNGNKTIETISFDRDYIDAYVELQYHGTAAFTGCKNLKKVVLPNLIKENEYNYVYPVTIDGEKTYKSKLLYGSLPSSLFKKCKKLEEIILPNNIEVIESSCFENCKSLKTLTIPDGVKVIGDRAASFDGCTNLEFLSLPETIEDMTPLNVSNNCTFKIPANSYIEEYIKSAEQEFIAKGLNISYGYINTSPTEILGDVDGNNELNINDVTLMQKKLVKIYPFEVNNYDINGDGKFNIWDATIAQRQIAHISE